ncbi:MAG: Ig-like domain repeat protein [Acidimicrobiales bacterium]
MTGFARRLIYLTPGVLALAGFTVAGAGTAALAQTTPIVTVTAPAGATTGPVEYQVNVADPTDSGVPTGVVTITDGIGGSCNTASLDGDGNGECTIDEPAGSYTITASYPGDSNYDPASGQTTETVGQATPIVTVTGASGAVTGPVSYSVTVAGVAGGVVPTGEVTVGDGAGGSCNVATLSGTGTGSCSISEVASASPYSVTASYLGDGNYTTGAGNTSEAVGEETPTALVTGPSSPTAGNVSYTVTITGKTGATTAPSGTVVVSAEDETNDQVSTCNVSLVASGNVGSGSCTIASVAATYFLTDTFTSDGNYASVHSHATVKVAVAPVTVTVLPKTNPGAGSAAGTVKESYTVSVDSSAAGIPGPTGTVVVSDGAGGTCTIKAITNNSGKCSITEALGSYSVSAAYSGDGNYASGTGTVTEYVATKTKTVASLTGSPVAPGNSVTLSATVTATAAGASVPSGNIVFVVNGVAQAPVALAGGTASLVYTVPDGTSAGNEKVVAEFQSANGDTWINSNSASIKFKVT